MQINYYKCQYCENDREEDERTAAVYPCYHPQNFEHDCPLSNKKEGQRADCKLID